MSARGCRRRESPRPLAGRHPATTLRVPHPFGVLCRKRGKPQITSRRFEGARLQPCRNGLIKSWASAPAMPPATTLRVPHPFGVLCRKGGAPQITSRRFERARLQPCREGPIKPRALAPEGRLRLACGAPAQPALARRNEIRGRLPGERPRLRPSDPDHASNLRPGAP